MSTEKQEGRYHPDPEINEEIAEDARTGETLSVFTLGLPPSPWECECGAAHDRGHFQLFNAHRCLRCGYIGRGGRLMDPSGFELYRRGLEATHA